MFIGGLNSSTTSESLRSYFSQFGEVASTTVMTDLSNGRSAFMFYRCYLCYVNIICLYNALYRLSNHF